MFAGSVQIIIPDPRGPKTYAFGKLRQTKNTTEAFLHHTALDKASNRIRIYFKSDPDPRSQIKVDPDTALPHDSYTLKFHFYL
jgi:hypothetical protein